MSWWERQWHKMLGGDVAVVGAFTAGSIGTDTISEKTGATGVTVDGVLLRDGLVAGQDPSLKTVTLAGVSPNGTTQGSATLLGTGYSRVSGASATDNAVKLPSAALSLHCVVLNYDGGDNLQVFPNTDDAIGTAGLNTAIVIAPLRGADFYAVDATYWVYVI